MSEWNDLELKLNIEIEHNICELQKMAAIYSRIGMTGQVAEISRLLAHPDVREIKNSQNKVRKTA